MKKDENIDILEWLANITSTKVCEHHINRQFIFNGYVYNALSTKSGYELVLMRELDTRHILRYIKMVVVKSNEPLFGAYLHSLFHNVDKFNGPCYRNLELSRFKVLDTNLDSKNYLESILLNENISWEKLKTRAIVTKVSDGIDILNEMITPKNDPFDDKKYITEESLMTNLWKISGLNSENPWFANDVKIYTEKMKDGRTITINNKYSDGFIAIYVLGSGIVTYLKLEDNYKGYTLDYSVEQWVKYFSSHRDECFDFDISSKEKMLDFITNFSYRKDPSYYKIGILERIKNNTMNQYSYTA